MSQLNTSLPTAFGGSETNLQASGGVPNNVQAFATANGIPVNEIAPFANVLQPIV